VPSPDPSSLKDYLTSVFRILINNQQEGTLSISPARLRAALRPILADHGFAAGELSVAIVDDPTIHELNRRHLAHDYPTDVLSFVLERDEGMLAGEVIASADTARHRAGDFGCDARDELLLYLIHGTLHLVGYRDSSAKERKEMRAQERHYLAQAGVVMVRSATRGQGDTHR